MRAVRLPWYISFSLLLLSARSSAATASNHDDSENLQVRLRSYTLPRDLRQQNGVEDMLSDEVGVAGTHLVGMRVILSVPQHLRFDRLEVEVADGLFLVQEKSKWKAVGRVVMDVARFLLIGRLFGGRGDDLELSATAWTVLMGNERLENEAVNIDTRDRTTIERDDDMTTNHGEFVVCRMVMAMNDMSELINMTIWATKLDSGEPVRFRIPRMLLPDEDAPRESES